LLAPKPSRTNWKSSTSSSERSETPESRCPPWPSISFYVRAGGAEDEALVDIAIADRRIVEIAERIVADAPAEELAGRLLIAGFIASHISSRQIPHPRSMRLLGRYARRSDRVGCSRQAFL
jgi:hypothetical protein